MPQNDTKIYQKGDIDANKPFDSFKTNEFDKHMDEDIKIYSKMAESTTYRDTLRKAADCCEQLNINNRITYLKYKIAYKELDNYSREYEEIESYRRLKDNEYRQIISTKYETKQRLANKQIINLVPEECFYSEQIKRQR